MSIRRRRKTKKFSSGKFLIVSRVKTSRQWRRIRSSFMVFVLCSFYPSVAALLKVCRRVFEFSLDSSLSGSFSFFGNMEHFRFWNFNLREISPSLNKSIEEVSAREIQIIQRIASMKSFNYLLRQFRHPQNNNKQNGIERRREILNLKNCRKFFHRLFSPTKKNHIHEHFAKVHRKNEDIFSRLRLKLFSFLIFHSSLLLSALKFFVRLSPPTKKKNAICFEGISEQLVKIPHTPTFPHFSLPSLNTLEKLLET